MFNKPKLAKVIGAFEIVGSVAAMMFCVLFFQQITQSLVSIMIYSIIPIMSIFSFIGGVRLIQQKEAGRKLSIFVQIIQLPYFSIAPALYKFGMCFFIHVGIKVPSISDDNLHLGLDSSFGFGVDYAITFADKLEETFLGINIVAFIILICLFKLKLVEKMTYNNTLNKDATTVAPIS